MNNHETEEIILNHNPRGGRPQRVGTTVFKGLDRPESLFEVREISSSRVIRIHLGYCACGRKVVADEGTATVLLQALQRIGLKQTSSSVSFFRRVRQSF